MKRCNLEKHAQKTGVENGVALMMKRNIYNTVLTPVCISLWCFACSSNLQITRCAEVKPSAAGNTRTAEVFKANEAPGKSYQILGKVFAQQRSGTIFSKPSEEKLLRMMWPVAAELGADALIDFRSSQYCESGFVPAKRWASCLAVRWLDNAIPPDNQCDFIVVIPDISTGNAAAANAELDSLIRKTAQYHLESKGYYAILLNHIEPAITIAQLKALALDSLRNFGDRRAGAVLLVEKDYAVEAPKTGPTGRAAAGVSATLISKKTGRVIWENSATGSDVTFATPTLPYAAFLADAETALYEAMQNLFMSLPTISTTVQKAGGTAAEEER